MSLWFFHLVFVLLGDLPKAMTELIMGFTRIFMRIFVLIWSMNALDGGGQKLIELIFLIMVGSLFCFHGWVLRIIVNFRQY